LTLSALQPHQQTITAIGAVLALDLGTATGWAIRRADGVIISGTATFKPGRYEGAGMRFLRFAQWLDSLNGPGVVYFEEVRRHRGVDAAHCYGGLLGTLTAWCEARTIPYAGIPVGMIKAHATGKGNASKEAMVAAMQAKGFSPADDNEADALAILFCALDTNATHKKAAA
jgi:Holliday junction resolvasome RuvABC endonuclease subunit